MYNAVYFDNFPLIILYQTPSTTLLAIFVMAFPIFVMAFPNDTFGSKMTSPLILDQGFTKAPNFGRKLHLDFFPLETAPKVCFQNWIANTQHIRWVAAEQTIQYYGCSTILNVSTILSTVDMSLSKS
jgi:hypothetical protein